MRLRRVESRNRGVTTKGEDKEEDGRRCVKCARERDKTKRKSCVSASGEFVARLVAFAVPLLSRPPFCPFLFTSIEHAYTSAGRYIQEWLFRRGWRHRSTNLPRWVQVPLAKLTPFTLQVYDNLHQYQRSRCSPLFFFFIRKGSNRICDMHERDSIDDYLRRYLGRNWRNLFFRYINSG